MSLACHHRHCTDEQNAPYDAMSVGRGGVAGPTPEGAGVEAAVVSVAIVYLHLPLMVQPVVPVAGKLLSTTSRIFMLTTLTITLLHISYIYQL